MDERKTRVVIYLNGREEKINVDFTDSEIDKLKNWWISKQEENTGYIINVVDATIIIKQTSITCISIVKSA